MSRKLKRLTVNPEVFLELFVNSDSYFKVVESEIPLDASFRGVAHNPVSNCWEIFFSHESFPEVKEDEQVPPVKLIKFKKFKVENEEN